RLMATEPPWGPRAVLRVTRFLNAVVTDLGNPLCLPLRLATRRGRWHVTRHAALPRLDLPAIVELDRLAHDRFPGMSQGRQVLPHRGQGHANFLGDLQVQALAVLLQALQGFHHCFPSLE